MKIIKIIQEKYTYALIKYKLTHNIEHIYNYYRKRGVIIGNNCNIYTKITSPEPYLITIGDNVTIAPGVNFICHDNSICKVHPQYTDIFGKITICNNCFIGVNSIVLPGVTIGENTIVAAGSVVTKSFESNLVIGGNPAKIITDINTYKEKTKKYILSTRGLSYYEKKSLLQQTDKLIKK